MPLNVKKEATSLFQPLFSFLYNQLATLYLILQIG